MKTKINLLPLLWVLLIPLTAALCQNKAAAPPKDNAKTKYSCYQENIDKENKNFLGDFSNKTGWIEKTPDEYLSKVSQPYTVTIDADALIANPPCADMLIMCGIRVFRCAGNLFSKSDLGKRATLSGRFFYKDCDGEMLLFYDEGDGNPPFTYFNRPKH